MGGFNSLFLSTPWFNTKLTGVFTDIGGQDVLVSWLHLFRFVILSSVNALREHISCRLWQCCSHTRTSRRIISLIILERTLVVCIIGFFYTMDDEITRNYKLMKNDRHHASKPKCNNISHTSSIWPCLFDNASSL